MKIDMHVHFLPKKTSVPDIPSISAVIKYAEKIGINGICLTEHLDADCYRELINLLFIENKLNFDEIDDGVLRSPAGLHLYCGAEVSTVHGGDIGLHAPPSVVLELSNKKGFYDASALKNAVSAHDCLLVAHHSMLPGKKLPIKEEPHLFDAIEVPPKDIQNKSAYADLAQLLNLPKVCGSDAHIWIQVGAGYFDSRSVREETEVPRAVLFKYIRSGTGNVVHQDDASDVIQLGRYLRSTHSANQL